MAAATMSVAALSYACGGGGRLLGPEAALNFAASSRVLVAAPTRFEASISVSNPTSAPITVSLRCMSIIVFDTPARDHEIYDSGAAADCAVTQETFQPNVKKTYSGTLTTANVLGSSGAPGVYYLSVALPIGSTTVLLPAGQVDLRR